MRREMKISGSWYPAGANRLIEDLDSYTDQTSRLAGVLLGAVLPHAGLEFSGRGMAHFFANAAASRNKVLLLAPSHYFGMQGNHLYTSDFTSYQTPLGEISGENALSGILRRNAHEDPLYINGTMAVAEEHAVEMFFPYIKHCFDNPSVTILLVPAVSSLGQLERLSDSLQEAIEESGEGSQTSIIASSDFTHYGSRFGHEPFAGVADGFQDLEDRVRESDLQVAAMLAEGDSTALLELNRDHRLSVCGIYPAMIASMLLRRFGSQGLLADYYNSNEIAGRSDEFVCYASLLFGRGTRFAAV